MYCRQCGKELKEGIRFCPNCGSAVEENKIEKTVENSVQTTPEPVKQKKSKKGMVIGLVAILALVGAGTAFGMTLSRKPDSGNKSSQEEDIMNGEETENDTEGHASADNDTNGNDNWEPLEYQSDILTVKKVGELPKAEDYNFYNECVFRNVDSSLYDWKGNKICSSPELMHHYRMNDILSVRTDDNEYLYNSNGELLIDLNELFEEVEGEIYSTFHRYECPYYWINDEEHNLLGVINLNNATLIPNLPLERDINFTGDNCIGKSNNLYFETEDGVELYDGDGNLIKKIEIETDYIKKFVNYFEVIVETEKDSEYYNSVNVQECTVYDEMGNPLFSYLSEYNGYDVELSDAGDGYFCFIIHAFEDYRDSWNCLVNENGDVLEVSTDEYYDFWQSGSISWIALSDNLIRYYYDENGIYYISEVKDADDHPEVVKYGIRSFDSEPEFDEEGNSIGSSYEIKYINSDDIVEVDSIYGSVDVFYYKEGKLYSFVDGSVALDGDYESYAYAYGFIYAKRSDGVYDIFEIVEYNPPYNYQPMTNGEILGNIADAPEVYLFGEAAVASEEIVYEEYASESDVWWCLQNFVDNTNKTSLHYIATGTDTKFDLVWDEDAGHWRLTTTRDGVTTSQLYDDDIIYPIDGTEETISGSTVLDENFDTGNYYGNEILGDVLALDADDANKNGETFSFIGKDSKFQNIYWDVTYNGEFWEVEVSKDDGFSLSGYFDEDFYFHVEE